MKKIIILGDAERLDDRLVDRLNHLFPECEIQVMDAGAGSALHVGSLSCLDFRGEMTDGSE